MSETDNATRRDLYRAAVGPKKEDYYVPLFLRFDEPGASMASWNWPAFFVAFFWFLYRRMYGYALAYFFLLPLVLFLLGMLAMNVLGEGTGTAIYGLASLSATYIVTPMFANALYHRHVKRMIAKKAQATLAVDQFISELERGPHTNNATWVAAPVAAFIVGIMAAIAIPAYQDYTLRSQVVKGLRLASEIKADVAASYAEEDSWPSSLSDMGYSEPISGKYVSEILVEDGAISIHYGAGANQILSGEVLTLRPSISREGEVVWSCGHAGSPGTDPRSGPSGLDGTSVPAKYLPVTCRGR